MEDEQKSEVESGIDTPGAEHADQSTEGSASVEQPAVDPETGGSSDTVSATGDVESTDSVEDAASGAAGEEAAAEDIVDSGAAEPKEPVDDLPPVDDIEEEVDPADLDKHWYILKVQVNRESSICETLKRRVQQYGLADFFGEMLVPTEDVREYTKSGKQRIVKRKLYPGYIMVNMAISEDSWWLVRDTPGIGDFTGMGGKPTPMQDDEIRRILDAMNPPEDREGEGKEEIKTAIKHKVGERVRVKDGNFENFEGEVSAIDERNGRITVLINIFGRLNPVELDHWQVEGL